MIEGDIMKPYCMLAYVVARKWKERKNKRELGSKTLIRRKLQSNAALCFWIYNHRR